MELLIPKTKIALPFSAAHSLLKKYPVAVDFLCDNRISDCHWHDFVQIWYTVSGSFSISVNGVKKKQTSGSLTIISPFAEHQIDSSESDLSELRVINCSFLSDVFVSGLLNFRPINFSTSAYNRTLLPTFSELRGEDKQHTDELFYDMLSLFYRDRTKNSKQIFRHIDKILQYCAKDLPEVGGNVISAKAENALCINNAVSFMSANFSGKISVEETCEHATMSRRSFLEYFKRITGKTCHNYLTLIRISHAINEMRYTDKIMSEISEECGFSSSSHFAKTISCECAVPPSVLKDKLNCWDKKFYNRHWNSRADLYSATGKISYE